MVKEDEILQNDIRGFERHSVDAESTSSGSDVDSSISPKSGETPPKTRPPTKEIIAKAEDQAVFRIRLFVLFMLVAFTAGAACLVYYFTHNGEVEAFEQAVLEESKKIYETIGTTLDSSLAAIDSYAISIGSHAKSSNSSWPFVVVPDHAARLSKIRSLSKGFWLAEYRVVQEDQRLEWEKFSIENAGWVDEALEIQKIDPTFKGTLVENYTSSAQIWEYAGIVPNGTGPYYPHWQEYPSVPVFYPAFNWDGSGYATLVNAIDDMEQGHKAVIGAASNLVDPDDPESQSFVDDTNIWLSGYVGEDDFDYTEPYADLHYPVFGDATGLFPSVGTGQDGAKLVSIVSMIFYWRSFVENILPPGSNGIVVVFENSCVPSFTYQINGPKAIYLGQGDQHDPKYDYLVQVATLDDLKEFHDSKTIRYTGFPLSDTTCPYTFRIYPSSETEDRFLTSKPAFYTFIAVAIFLITSGSFLLYDILVERRQKKVMKSAIQSTAIVSSLFPSTVRKRLYDMEEGESGGTSEPQKTRLKTWLSDGKDVSIMDGSTRNMLSSQLAGKPIADLFPDSTVMFADIEGFTAWSSIREPSQVFVLLENLYGGFDAIATRRGVFKVETIGDSYVAVAGLPEPRPDHAVVMTKFAGDCQVRMKEVTRALGVTLGPDTEDLAMRFGLHSGPVTAGVLRGQKSRFQLFGDTVNTASRMESSGYRDRIQVSQATADHLIQARKSHWLQVREDTVEIKGKGMMQTYWAYPKSGGARSIATESTNSDNYGMDPVVFASTKITRLVEWNVDVLAGLIRHIVHRRKAVESSGDKSAQRNVAAPPSNGDIAEGSTVLDEVREIIELPGYDGYNNSVEDASSIVLDPCVMSQLREFIVAISKSYEKNPFHNFEHASHVCMSVAKLMSRIVAADDVYDKSQDMKKGASIGSSKHDHTYGITSDPLTQFACVFSALIHDAEHPGVPNAQLVKEETPLAIKYKGRSVAEQNSVDISWTIFMKAKFADLRKVICPTENEMRRFRQLVVNCVMATDIMDKDLKTLRNARWDTAFSARAAEEPAEVSRNRKATIVIEHLIQASDVAHTMQHWHIYRKWNERFFIEMYRAFKEGRSEQDPAEFWYKGEMGFFDFYILPLAKKLSECGVFGVSSDEYLNYAMKNREEWELKGQEVVEGMVKRLNGSAKDLKKLAIVAES